MMRLHLLISVLWVVTEVHSAYTPEQAMVDVTNEFGVCVLQLIASSSENVAFSPYGLVSVGLVLYEGANGPTAAEIHNTFRLPWDKDVTRIGFRDLHRYLKSYFTNDGFLRGLVLNKPNLVLFKNYTDQMQFYGFDLKAESTSGGASTISSTTQAATTTPLMENNQTTLPMTTPIKTTTILTTTPIETTTSKETTTMPTMTTTTKKTTTTKPMTTTKKSTTTKPTTTTRKTTTTKPTTTATTTTKATTQPIPTTTKATTQPPPTTTEATTQPPTTTEPTTPEPTTAMTTEEMSDEMEDKEGEMEIDQTETPTPTTEKVEPLTTDTSPPTVSTTAETSSAPTSVSSEPSEIPSTTVIPVLTTESQSESPGTTLIPEETSPTIVGLTTETAAISPVTELPTTIPVETATSGLPSTERLTIESITSGELSSTSTVSTQQTETTVISTQATESSEESTSTELPPLAGFLRSMSTSSDLPSSTSGLEEEPLESSLTSERTSLPSSLAPESASSDASSTETSVSSYPREIILETTSSSQNPSSDSPSSSDSPLQSAESLAMTVSESTEDIPRSIPEEFTAETMSVSETTVTVTFPSVQQMSNLPSTTPAVMSSSESSSTTSSQGISKRSAFRRRGKKLLNPSLPNSQGLSSTRLINSMAFHSSTFPKKRRSLISPKDYVAEHREYIPNWLPHYQDPRWSYNVPSENWFFTYAGGERVPILTYSAYLPFAHVPEIKSLVLQLPLDDPRYFMLVLLPEERGGLSQLLFDLQWCSVRYLMDQLVVTAIYATVPSFTVVKHVNLVPALIQLGIRCLFDPHSADLTLMTSERGIFVRNIDQVVTVSLRKYYSNHKWFEAGPDDIDQQFIANHPFAYLVLDKESLVTLMAGTIVNPLGGRRH